VDVYSSFVLLAVGELTAELQAGTARVSQPRESEPIKGAAVLRKHALVPYEKKVRARNGNGGAWAAFEWLSPLRVVRRVRETARSVGAWAQDAASHLRADLATARLEVGAVARSVGTGSLLGAGAATLGLLGSLSLLTAIILVIGDQWLARDWYALGALLVAVIAAAVTWTFARRGLAALSSSARPVTKGR